MNYDMEQKKIIVLDEPREVNVAEWAFSHPGCDSVVEFMDGSQMMIVFAYSNDAKANNDLKKYKKEHFPGKYILMGVTKDAATCSFI